MTNKRHKSLYVGFANSLSRRSWEHKNKINPNSFTAKYNINKLVYYENYKYANDGIAREKQLKGWTREKKDELINSFNPTWRDLFDDLL